jgi:hypothetical protein
MCFLPSDGRRKQRARIGRLLHLCVRVCSEWHEPALEQAKSMLHASLVPSQLQRSSHSVAGS